MLTSAVWWSIVLNTNIGASITKGPLFGMLAGATLAQHSTVCRPTVITAESSTHAKQAGCLTLLVCCIGRAGGMQLELQSADLKERYRTRLLYAISDAEKAAAAKELDDACLLDLEWADLGTTAEAVDAQLEGVKKKFSQITRQQV